MVGVTPMHDVRHAPFEQIDPAPQMVPHVPQFVGSVCVFVQVPAQTIAPAAMPVHTHEPDRHACAGGQVIPHAPQLFASNCVLTHTVPHMAM